VAEEISRFYPPCAKADRDHVNAYTLVRSQEALMAKLGVRHPSNGPHELTHGLHSQLVRLFGNFDDVKNIRESSQGGFSVQSNEIQAVYFKDGLFAFCHDPSGLKQQDVIDAIPSFARQWDRFGLYVRRGLAAGSGHTVGYLIDELSAYCAGARAALSQHAEVVRLNNERPGTFIVNEAGHCEIAVFSLAMAMKADSRPNAFRTPEDKHQFLAVIAALTEQAFLIERELCDAKRFPAYNSATSPRNPVALNFLKEPSAASLRTWVESTYGEKWFKNVFAGETIWTQTKLAADLRTARDVEVSQ